MSFILIFQCLGDSLDTDYDVYILRNDERDYSTGRFTLLAVLVRTWDSEMCEAMLFKLVDCDPPAYEALPCSPLKGGRQKWDIQDLTTACTEGADSGGESGHGMVVAWLGSALVVACTGQGRPGPWARRGRHAPLGRGFNWSPGRSQEEVQTSRILHASSWLQLNFAPLRCKIMHPYEFCTQSDRLLEPPMLCLCLHLPVVSTWSRCDSWIHRVQC